MHIKIETDEKGKQGSPEMKPDINQFLSREEKDDLQISIIIPTFHRLNDLTLCLNSIKPQSVTPLEILIVDDSKNSEIEELIFQRKKDFMQEGMVLKYIRNVREKSAAIARNVGVEYASGDIVLFLDSDIILEKDYIKEILKIYQTHTTTLGVQGYITNNRAYTRLNNIARKLFFQSHMEKNRCRVLKSTATTYPNKLDRVISCEWFSGSNCSYRKAIFNIFKFDEQLKKYSYYEDVDLSYNISKQYHDSLKMTPFARLIHTESIEGRIIGKDLLKRKEIYRLYFFYKNIRHQYINNLIFVWSRIGFILFNYNNIHLNDLIRAYLYNLKHLREIKNKNLDFF